MATSRSTNQNADQILKQPLPPLKTGPHTTQSSAIHPTIFVGRLGEWNGFEAEVRRAIDRRRWRNIAIPYTQTGEHVHVGDEHGVQGRFQERVGEIVSHIALQEPPSFAFADSKCGVPRISATPDFIIMKERGDAIVVGEIKVPWITDHHIGRVVAEAQSGFGDRELRNVLGQIADYMDVMNLKYGALTTYDETLFLRQTVVGGRWTLELSPVKHFSDTYTNADPQSVTVTQCFWYLGQLALKGARFNRSGGSGSQGQIMPWTN